MALATSGALSLNQIHVEAGGSSGTTASLNDSDIRGLTAASGRTINSTLGTNIDFADFYGASAAASVPASFGKTGVTPGVLQIVFTYTYYVYTNTQYTGTAYSGMQNPVNVQFNENSSFTDSNGDTQTIIYLAHVQNKSPSPAGVMIRFLGHNVSTSSWTLSYGNATITGNSGFTMPNLTAYNTPTVSNGTVGSHNTTDFFYTRTNQIGTTAFPTGRNQSWSIT